MRSWIVPVIVAATAVTIFGACGGGSSSTSTPATTKATTAPAASASAAAASPTDLIATKKSPASLAVDDPAWTDAAVTSIQTVVITGSKATQPVAVASQALYSDTDIWFRFSWPDATESDTAVFTWDGTKWNPSTNISERFALNWEITKVADFEAKGCQGICHRTTTDPIEKWYMIAPKAGDLIDNWQWTSATNGVMGFGNDLTISGGELPDPKVLESSIVADKLDSGGTVTNSAAAPATPGPLKMQDPAKPATYGAKYLAAADAIPIDMSKVKVGDNIPRTLLAPPVGSRADITAKQAYAGGKWTIVLHRKLDTGHPDDVKFVPPQIYPFGLAVWNDLDHFNHTVTDGPYLLKFKTQ